MKISIHCKAIIAAVTLSLALLSCSKNTDYQPVEISGLSIIHASPTTEKLNVFVDNTRATLNEFAFGSKVDYLNAYAGSRRFDVAKATTNISLKTEQLTLEPTLGYSLFVIDKLENIKFLLLKDDLTKPAAGKARIRFVNLSPDGGTLNLAIQGKTEDLFTNKAFKEYSTFETIDAAEKVTFNIKNTATSAIETFLADIKIEDGKIYTIYAKGLKATVDETKFGAAIFTHK